MNAVHAPVAGHVGVREHYRAENTGLLGQGDMGEGSESPATSEDALVYYEVIRAALARDDGSEVPANALLLAKAAEQAAAGSIDTGAELQELGATAEKLGAIPNSDLRSLRGAFGEDLQRLINEFRSDPRPTPHGDDVP